MKFFKKLFSKKEEEKSEPQILLEERSPVCPITAIVEQDDRVAYLYLWGDENKSFGTKACWIRNLVPAPENFDSNSPAPPLMPKEFCKYPEGLFPLKKEDIFIIWSEEGDGVALYEKGDMVASIPSWGGHKGFPGYARDCKGQGNFAWELEREDRYFERFEKANKYWNDWYVEESHFYNYQPKILEIYNNYLGSSDLYFAIDGGEIPMRGLFLRKGESKTVFATVGMSLVPQPTVELFFDDPSEANKIELGLMLNSPFSEDSIQRIGNTISSIAAVPWENVSWLGEGHTINFNFPDFDNFNAVIFTNRLSILPKIEFENLGISKVKFLWMIPITDAERKLTMDSGSDELIQKLNLIGEEIFNLDRTE